jgi:hypothetical protein
MMQVEKSIDREEFLAFKLARPNLTNTEKVKITFKY